MALKAMTSASLLSSFQSSLTAALKAEGLIPLSVGITKPTRVAENFADVATDAIAQIDAGTVQFGARSGDRYGTAKNSYTAARFAMIASLENVSPKSYPDAGGRSVGLGFHMNKEGARDVWEKAFGNTVSFDDVYAGKASLTSAQSKHLFDNDIRYYEQVVDRALGGKAVTQNQRLALVSIAYNAPARLAKLAPTLQNGTNAEITAALLTQTFNPNNSAVEAIKQRRYIETSLFNSTAEASALMPKFDDYFASVAVSPEGVKVQGKKVTDTNTQMSYVPTADGKVGVAILSDNLAPIQYDNKGATRSLTVEANLEAQIRQSVTSVYGADYRVSIISGGQDDTTGKKGSRRHTTLTAADVYIYDPSGKKLTAEQMKPLAQDWIARDIGSVGLPTGNSTQSMHLDLIGGSVPGSTKLKSGEGRFWFYGGEDAAMRKTLTSKTAPKYMLDPVAVAQGYVPPGSIPTVGSELSTNGSKAPIPATKSDAVRAAQIAAGVDRDINGTKPPVSGLRIPVAPGATPPPPRPRPGNAPTVLDIKAMKEQEAKAAAVKAVKPPVAGLRLPVAPTGYPGSPKDASGRPISAVEAWGNTPAAIAFDEQFGPKKAATVPSVVRQAAIPGKSPLANGASLSVPARGTGSMGIPVPSAAAPRPVARPTTIGSTTSTTRTPIGGVTATGARGDYGSSPGQSTAGLKPGDRTYNADTNTWELK